ncbi:MAG: metallophosphoesterase [Candidatus Aenigmarchaeota archaeon]|nr:metallophosphoesterase [Candidatus Aenigmarchaeota archaeon]
MFIKNEPAMKIRDCLVIADLHLGITRELWEYGFSMPSQVESLAKRINDLLAKTGAKCLIILGDVKHKVPGVSFQEMREIPEFLSLINAKTTIIKGNHDTFLEKIADVKIKKSLVIENCFLTHGHKNVKTNKKIIVIGHNHPQIKFKDKMGATYVQPVWVHGRSELTTEGRRFGYGKKKIIIMPAFNELAGGHAINEDFSVMGPIARKMDIKNAKAFLLDGTDIGRIKDLMV